MKLFYLSLIRQLTLSLSRYTVDITDNMTQKQTIVKSFIGVYM